MNPVRDPPARTEWRAGRSPKATVITETNGLRLSGRILYGNIQQ
jgi:hypothetical protein